MGARRTAWLVVPLLVGGALGLPVQAAPAAPPAALDASVLAARLGGAAVVDTGASRAGTRTTAEALTSLRRHGDTAAWLSSVAAAVRAAQPAAPAALVAVAPEEPPQATPGGGEQGSWAGTGPAGDVDGDGLVDVLTLSFDAGTFILQARRGTDGALLWSRDLAGGFGALALPVGRDLTGDGADDLMHVVVSGTDEYTDTQSDTSFSYRYRADHTTFVGVVSGMDGSVVWETTRDGALDESYSHSTDPAAVTWQEEYQLRSTALAVLPLVSDDVTGDGVADVALSTVDLDVDASRTSAGALVTYAGQVRETLRSSTDAVLLDGPTGTVVGGREVADQAGVSVLLPAGRVTGDQRGELLWSTERSADLDAVCVAAHTVRECTAEPAADVDVELLSGAALTPVWAVTTTGAWSHAFPLGHDVDRDGAADLGLYVDHPGSRFAVLSGADGTALWQAVAEESLYLVGIDDGVAALGSFRSPDDGVGVEVVVERHDVATGAVLGTAVHRLTAPSVAGDHAGYTTVALLDSAPDADGDGRDELLVGMAVEAQSEHESQARSVNVVEGLADGRAVRTREGDDLALVERAGDLDGDGLEDVREDVLTFRADELFGVDSVSTARRVVDGVALWTLSGDLFSLPIGAGDQDGASGAELVDVHVAPDLPLQVRSLRGSDLSVRWSADANGRPPL